jgi:hypothetical protein
MCGKQESCIQKTLVGHITERDHLEEVDVYGGGGVNIKKDLQELWAELIHVD